MRGGGEIRDNIQDNGVGRGGASQADRSTDRQIDSEGGAVRSQGLTPPAGLQCRRSVTAIDLLDLRLYSPLGARLQCRRAGAGGSGGASARRQAKSGQKRRQRRRCEKSCSKRFLTPRSQRRRWACSARLRVRYPPALDPTPTLAQPDRGRRGARSAPATSPARPGGRPAPSRLPRRGLAGPHLRGQV